MYSDQQIKESLFLPHTSFSMRANLKEKEPQLLEFWNNIQLYNQITQQSASYKSFIVHDGPPYANGSIHLGHALNKTLKDTACRFARLRGFFAPLKPGWDCHGLPIEWSIEKELKTQKKSLSTLDFRKECRDYAQKWIHQQSLDFQRLGVCADFASPYTTMQPQSEARIIAQLHSLLRAGLLYRHTRPVFWSIAEQTALAEAEVEYINKTSTSVFLKYPLARAPEPSHKPAFLAIWTTTPWTIPASQAVAFSTKISYVAVDMDTHILWCSENLWPTLAEKINAQNAPILQTVSGAIWEGAVALHPWHDKGYDRSLPLLPGTHITDCQGTGFVHTAPAHGADDAHICQQHNISTEHIIDSYGVYQKHLPHLAGKHIFKDEEFILELLQPHLLTQESITHSYPHSWRSKKPLIMRATPQWFISLDHLKKDALDKLPSLTWIPHTSSQRLSSMLNNRPDWCVSRQRTWGVPLAFFVHKETGAPLTDNEVLSNIESTIARQGSDIWFDKEAPSLLPPHLQDEYEKVHDIVDVWFESGASFSYVLQPSKQFPADLLLEGSDQHRGWFQSSLLCSLYATNEFCTKAIFTHGFIVDKDGKKMSKSQGNTLKVSEIVEQYGADILRLSIMQSDYHNDVKIGHNILKAHTDTYRKIRNSLRFLLGNLHHQNTIFKGKHPLLEQYMLHHVFCVHQKILDLLEKHDFHEITKTIHVFCTHSLSSFYFDIRKDTLYCEPTSSSKRLSCLHVLNVIFQYLVRWIAPIMPFTAEDAWQCSGHTTNLESIHLATFETPNPKWFQPELEPVFEDIMALRSHILKSIESMREQNIIGSSLETNIDVFGSSTIPAPDLEDILITSQVRLSANAHSSSFSVHDTPFSYRVNKASEKKCQRCWKQRSDVHDNLCNRCIKAMEEYVEAS